jgi:hypothetical protein
MVVRMRRPLLVALTLAGTAACSYIFELPEAAVLPTETGTGDASADAVVDDAPRYIDAPPPIPFCATQTAPFLYCNDFDIEPAPDLASIGAVQTTGGQLLLSSAVALSVPRSLLSNIQGTSSVASVTHALEASPDGITLSFHQLVSAWDTPGATLSGIELTDGTRQCFVGLEGTATWTITQVCLEDGAETARESTDSASPIVRGRWQRFGITVTFTPSPTVTLDIDGARTTAAGVAPLARAATSITLGTKIAPSGSLTLFQDNVLVTSP